MEFVPWLRNPYESARANPLQLVKAKNRQDDSSNEEIQNDMVGKLMKHCLRLE
jgi:hypothetical protein